MKVKVRWLIYGKVDGFRVININGAGQVARVILGYGSVDWVRGWFCRSLILFNRLMAERVGFEPTIYCLNTCFILFF